MAEVENNLLWLAGFFDARGYVKLWDDKSQHGHYRLIVYMRCSSVKMLTKLRDQWGGSVYQLKHSARWIIYGNNAARLLRDLQPYLRVKANMVRNCLDLRVFQKEAVIKRLNRHTPYPEELKEINRRVQLIRQASTGTWQNYHQVLL